MEVVEFVRANWRLIYTVYRGHPETRRNVLGEHLLAGEGFTCFFIPYLWIDLFCERIVPADVESMRAGHLYLCDASDHVFTFVYIDEATVVYTDYYSEMRGVEHGFRISIMSGEEARAALRLLQSRARELIAAFHRNGRPPLSKKPSTYPVSVVEYPIVRTPTLATLLEVCRTCELFDLEEFRDHELSRDRVFDARWSALFERLSSLCLGV